MASPYLSEIRIMSFEFAPVGWAFCNGQLLPINQNAALFSLIGTFYGGNGTTNFGLPNLQGNVPIHMGTGYAIGQTGGEASHTLSLGEVPAHLHTVNGSTNPAATNVPTGNLLATSAADVYTPPSNGQLVSLAPAVLSIAGGSQPHLNQQPYLTLSFCIALQGIYPTRN
jgi:microcystin-dependent protein